MFKVLTCKLNLVVIHRRNSERYFPCVVIKLIRKFKLEYKNCFPNDLHSIL